MDLNITLKGRQLYRSNTQGWIFGVCAGIAERLDVTPLAIRAMFVLLAFSIVVPALYIILGLMIPSEALA